MTAPVAVTGAGGFLGRRLVRALVAAGRPVLALARDPSRVPAGSGVEVRRWEAGEDPGLPAGLAAVVHAAAHRPARYDDPSEAHRCLEVNALATLALAGRAADAGAGRFVYLSAGNVYRPLDRPAREDDPIWPSHRAPFYLGSKICGEFFLEALAGRLPVCRLRPAAIYGPGMPPGLVPTFLGRLRSGQPITVADGGRYRADLVYVDDVVGAVLAAIDRGEEGPFNLGSGAATPVGELAALLVGLLGADPALVRVEPPVGEAPGFAALDSGRAAARLGYRPRVAAEGLRDWLREEA